MKEEEKFKQNIMEAVIEHNIEMLEDIQKGCKII